MNHTRNAVVALLFTIAIAAPSLVIGLTLTGSAHALEIPSECLVKSDKVCRIPVSAIRSASVGEREQALSYLKANGITYRIVHEKRRAVAKAKVIRAPVARKTTSQKKPSARRAAHRVRDTPIPKPSPRTVPLPQPTTPSPAVQGPAATEASPAPSPPEIPVTPPSPPASPEKEPPNQAKGKCDDWSHRWRWLCRNW